MVQRIGVLGLFLLLTYAASFLTPCEARKQLKRSKALNPHIVVHYADAEPNSIGSPYYLPPPYEGLMGPTTSPLEDPPYCIYPPLTPFPPTTTTPSPTLPNLPSPPPPTILPHKPPPVYTPNPPEFPTPTVPGFEPSPPRFGSSPPGFVPNPPGFSPGPPIFLPPIVYPPPTAPPPPRSGSTGLGLWCVAKPTVPDPIIQEAMNYACGSGADCDSILPNGACYQPDTLLAHASFAFNSYWQRTKVAGGTCDFGGTAMLITKDPSYDGCRFNIN